MVSKHFLFEDSYTVVNELTEKFINSEIKGVIACIDEELKEYPLEVCTEKQWILSATRYLPDYDINGFGSFQEIKMAIDSRREELIAQAEEKLESKKKHLIELRQEPDIDGDEEKIYEIDLDEDGDARDVLMYAMRNGPDGQEAEDLIDFIDFTLSFVYAATKRTVGLELYYDRIRREYSIHRSVCDPARCEVGQMWRYGIIMYGCGRLTAIRAMREHQNEARRKGGKAKTLTHESKQIVEMAEYLKSQNWIVPADFSFDYNDWRRSKKDLSTLKESTMRDHLKRTLDFHKNGLL